MGWLVNSHPTKIRRRDNATNTVQLFTHVVPRVGVCAIHNTEVHAVLDDIRPGAFVTSNMQRKDNLMKYKVILADPPWKYSDDRKHKPGYAGITYDVMRTQDICDIPVKDIADDESMLFLWTTMPMIPDALKVMKAWGFKYKTCAFTWIKTNPRSGTPAYLMGQYTMGSTELCLLGTRGHRWRESRNVKQLVIAPRTGHSRKPQEVRKRIVELCGDVPRVELFARDCDEGWICWGNVIDGRDIRDVLKGETDE